MHTLEEIRSCTPADPNEAPLEDIMPQAACEALLRDAVQGLPPHYTPGTLRQWLQATHPQAWAIGAPPPPHHHHTGEGKGTGEGRARGRDGHSHGSAQGDRQAPIGTGHRERHNVGAGNHQRARKGREQGPRRRERGQHGGQRDPHAGRAYNDGGTSAPPPPADAARPPGAHASKTCRRSANSPPYGSHRHTPTSHRKSHRG